MGERKAKWNKTNKLTVRMVSGQGGQVGVEHKNDATDFVN